MSKERLEEIIENLPYSIRYEGNVETLIKYTREQAERALKNADDLHVMDLQLASEQKEIKKLQDENETLSAANNDLLHEIRVLKNQMNDQTNLRILEFKVQNKQLLKQNKRYCEALEFYAMSGQAIGETKHGEVARKALEGGG